MQGSRVGEEQVEVKRAEVKFNKTPKMLFL